VIPRTPAKRGREEEGKQRMGREGREGKISCKFSLKIPWAALWLWWGHGD